MDISFSNGSISRSGRLVKRREVFSEPLIVVQSKAFRSTERYNKNDFIQPDRYKVSTGFEQKETRINSPFKDFFTGSRHYQKG